jgi:hypothetical protein
VKLILDTVEEIREADPTTSALRIWRILPTLYDTRLAHHREILAALRVKYPRLLYSDPVKATTKYKDAVTERADAGYLDPKIAEYWDKLATLLIKESNIVKEASDSETVLKSQGKEGRPSQSDAVIQQDSDMVKREQFTEKITFYLTVEQANKLDDLAHDYKKRRGKRINRNDIVRYLIDHCTLESLEAR